MHRKSLGINTAISTRTGVFEGYSFAIPINIATRIVDDIIKNGSYERPYLGVNISELDAEYANELGVSISQGVVVEALAKGGSAEYAGMLPKDIIIGVQGRTIKSVPELQEAIGSANVGDRLNVKVLRKGREIEIPVTLKAG
ncbi:MAG: PDZ domain-containing protein [Saprospiraceae bacterium]